MNKKIILLAGAAMFLTGTASAMELNPYIGLDYVYSKADFKSDRLSAFDTQSLKDHYNSGMVSIGMRPLEYMSLEAFFQQSAEQKGDKIIEASGAEHKIKSEFPNLEVLCGEGGLIELAQNNENDMLLTATNGIAGLKPTLCANGSCSTPKALNLSTEILSVSKS